MRSSFESRDGQQSGGLPLSALSNWLVSLPNESLSTKADVPPPSEKSVQRAAFVKQLLLSSLDYPLYQPITAGTSSAHMQSNSRWRLDAPIEEGLTTLANWLSAVCDLGHVGIVYAAALSACGIDSLKGICEMKETDWPAAIEPKHKRLIIAEAMSAVKTSPNL